MNKPAIKLEEIIYEITGKCNNGCKYCGSKDQWDTEIDTNTIDRIVDAIAEFPPTAIDVSGGDPLLVPLATHQRLVKVLKDKGVQVKILFNPKSFKQLSPMIFDDKIKILESYDWVGVSLNEQVEIDQFFATFGNRLPLVDKMTVITNFNINNVFLFDKIRTVVSTYNMNWQVQYTMYNDMESSDAIYNNDEALKHLFDKIQTAIDQKVKVVLADDMNNGSCSAGVKSIGILSNGDVVPCLSMRSWVSNINDLVQGNIPYSQLQAIWENKFLEQRFRSCKCCKDHCKNKTYEPKYTVKGVFEVLEKTEKAEDRPIMMLYGFPAKKQYPDKDLRLAMRYGFMPRESFKPKPSYSPVVTVYAVFSGDYKFDNTYTTVVDNTEIA
jgi:MoaA/NifB/PqqE/SkfB family radical SAM enzyme